MSSRDKTRDVHREIFKGETICCQGIENGVETCLDHLKSMTIFGVLILAAYCITMTVMVTPVVMGVAIPAAIVLAVSTGMVESDDCGGCCKVAGFVGFAVEIALMIVLCTVPVFASTITYVFAPIVIAVTIVCIVLSAVYLRSVNRLAWLKWREEEELYRMEQGRVPHLL